MRNVIATPDGTIYYEGGKTIPTRLDKYGYPRVTIYLGNGKYVVKSVHRLVAEQHIPNPSNLPQVNHKDFNKQNNCVDNLEWVSASTNIKHAYDAGKIKFVPRCTKNAPRDSLGRFVSGS